MHSRDDRPVVTISSTISTRAPFAILKPRRKHQLAINAFKENRGHAKLPAHFIAHDHATHGRRSHKINLAQRSTFAASALHSRCGPRGVHQHPGALQVA